MRYLRNVVDGTIYEWHPILAEHPKCTEVSEEQAFPERFIPKAQRGRKAQVDLTTVDAPEEPEAVNEALSNDASKGLSK